MDSSPPAAPSSLPRLDQSKPHSYLAPRKRIHDGEDVSHFLASQAYKDIGVFLLQLNRSMCPRKSSTSDADAAITFPVAPDQSFPEPVRKLQCVILKLGEFVEQAPPDTGPRRFGNVAFRTWLGIVESHANELLAECLPSHLGPPSHNQNGDGDGDGDITGSETEGETSVADNCSRSNSKIRQEENTLHAELRSYFTGSFGSKQRLDYGTGHELSFLAFLGCLWKLGVFDSAAEEEEQTSRQIVLGILHPYLQLIRLVIKTYTLEPAGSHGVWGLDDHCFLPYIFGSAQLSRPISPSEAMSVEGSLESAPATGDVVKKPVVEKWRDKNLYFGAVGFINDVKTGPFWEHSPILFDISGVRSGWGKINKGMLKMFNAEVLSKFPVVQHFPFGSLFSWDRDPDAVEQKQTIHMSAQPHYSSSGMSSAIPPIGGVTAAPWTQTSSRAPTSIPGGMDQHLGYHPHHLPHGPGLAQAQQLHGQQRQSLRWVQESHIHVYLSRQDHSAAQPGANLVAEEETQEVPQPDPRETWQERAAPKIRKLSQCP
ncbi:hypothetical protein MKZ38_009112 [Zalerion maritima]|uniref:Serine/threonine-protein phosphatase 2A activator n=1 Tax=Zalerion maritima TaxID=339359 RepID=A0AAD5WT51_9PEZI|nr:hypothetical protein MKZ38_009112 [Zalerion maritima]